MVYDHRLEGKRGHGNDGKEGNHRVLAVLLSARRRAGGFFFSGAGRRGRGCAGASLDKHMWAVGVAGPAAAAGARGGLLRGARDQLCG